MKKDNDFFDWFERNARVDSLEDFESKSKGGINPPPENASCMCCGRHISELVPFGGPGDPLLGDFSGALLIKKYRYDAPYDERAAKLFNHILSSNVCEIDKLYEYMVDKYGEEGDRIYCQAILQGTVSKSWECRDCAVLDDNEYWQVIMETTEEEQ